MFGLSTTALALLGVVTLGLLAAIAGVGWYYRQYRAALDAGLEDVIEESDGEITFEPPDVRRSPLDYVRVMRHYQRAQKLAKKGYVRWYRLGSTMSRPTWVQPEQTGTGLPKYEVDGQPYYFPKESMVSDALTGAWTAIHPEGEANPINLRDPAYPGIETDLLERTINMEAEDSPDSGLFGGLGNLDTQTMIYLGVGGLFAVYALWYYLNGGL